MSDTDVLLIVALRTDVPQMPRRIRALLEVAMPGEPSESQAWIFARPVDELTAADHANLVALAGEDAVARLQIGDAPPGASG